MNWFIDNIETISTILIGLNVFLCARNNIWNWAVGLVAVAVYGYAAYFLWGLYADAYLQIVYFVSGIIGWWYWAKGGANNNQARIRDLSKWGILYSIIIISVGTYFLGNSLLNNTDSTVPYLDAYTTVICLVAQAMLMFRIRFAWVLWVAANVVYVYLFHIKGLDNLAILYTLFIANAVYGYIQWTNEMKKEITCN